MKKTSGLKKALLLLLVVALVAPMVLFSQASAASKCKVNGVTFKLPAGFKSAGNMNMDGQMGEEFTKASMVMLEKSDTVGAMIIVADAKKKMSVADMEKEIKDGLNNSDTSADISSMLAQFGGDLKYDIVKTKVGKALHMTITATQAGQKMAVDTYVLFKGKKMVMVMGINTSVLSIVNSMK